MTQSNSYISASLRNKALLALGSAVAVLSLVSNDAAANNGNHNGSCRQMDGAFTSYVFTPPQCESPVGICTLGTLTGDMPSSYRFVMDTLANAGDPHDPSKFVYTGHSLITDSKGRQMFGHDTGVMHINADPTKGSPFVTTVNVAGGTKKYKHASGQVVATGVMTFATGSAVGDYDADICHNGNDDDDDD